MVDGWPRQESCYPAQSGGCRHGEKRRRRTRSRCCRRTPSRRRSPHCRSQWKPHKEDHLALLPPEALLRVVPPPLGPLGGMLAGRRCRGQVSGGQQQSNYVENFKDKPDACKDAVRQVRIKVAFQKYRQNKVFRAAKTHNRIRNRIHLKMSTLPRTSGQA